MHPLLSAAEKPARTAAAPAEAPAAAAEEKAENPACFMRWRQTRELTVGPPPLGDGHTMAASDATTSGKLTVGVISDIKEFLPETVANLKAFAAWISSGRWPGRQRDVAYSQGDGAVLRPRGEFSVLVLAPQATRAPRDSTWLTNIAADHPQIINGNRSARPR